MFKKNRTDFPTLDTENPPVYLDNACMTLRPKSVVEAIRSYYEESLVVVDALCTATQLRYQEK